MSDIDTETFCADTLRGLVAGHATTVRYRATRSGCSAPRSAARLPGRSCYRNLAYWWVVAGLTVGLRRREARRSGSGWSTVLSLHHCSFPTIVDRVTDRGRWNHLLWIAILYHVAERQGLTRLAQRQARSLRHYSHW